MPVRVLEISGVPSPKPVVRGVGDFRSRLLRLFHRCIDFLSGFYDVADGELCGARRADGYFCVLGQRGLWIQRQNEIVVHDEEDHGAVLEFRADDPLRRQTHSVAIKTQGSVQIADPQCDDFDPRSHILTRLLVADGAVILCYRAASNSSTTLPSGSSIKICLPPGPTTTSLRKRRPARFISATRDTRSSISTTKRFHPPGLGRLPSGMGRAAELCGPASEYDSVHATKVVPRVRVGRAVGIIGSTICTSIPQ